MSSTKTWDDVWEYSKVQEWDRLSDEILRTLLSEIGSPSGLEVLEAGSGTGRISARLAKAGASVHLLDYSQKALDISRTIFSTMGLRAETVRGDIRGMPYRDGQFDVVWSSGVLEHYDFCTQLQMLREMTRVTKDGGLIIAIVPFAGSPFYRLGKWWAEKTGSWPYGQEDPMWTFKEHEPYLDVHLLHEYSIARNTSLDFLEAVPGGSALKSQFALELALDPTLREAIPGYLMVSVFKKDKNKDTLAVTDGSVPHASPMGGPASATRASRETGSRASLPPILCLSSIDWSFLKQRPQHMMLKLRDIGHRICYVNWKRNNLRVEDLNALRRQIVPDNQDGALPAERSGKAVRWEVPKDPSALRDVDRLFASCASSILEEVEPEIMQVRWIGSLVDKDGISVDADLLFLDWLIRFLKLEGCITWIISPLWWQIVSGRKDFGLTMYDCVDEMAEPGTPFARLERNLVESSDVVFATARSIVRNKRGDNSSIFYVPNGVDQALFGAPALEPDDVRHIPHPRIGFVGAVSTWVDTELLLAVAVERPNWSVVTIGPSFVPLKGDGLKNLYQLGTKAYDQMPAYYRSLDVGVIPFKEDHIAARNSNPIKAYEYLAAGVPVVSTRIPELEQFSTVFRIADSREGFIAAVEECLKSKGKADAVTRNGDAVHLLNSLEWRNLAEVSSGLARAHLAAKHGDYNQAAAIARSILPKAQDKATVHGFVRRMRRMARAFPPQQPRSSASASAASDPRQTPEHVTAPLQPLEISGKLPYCILIYPDWRQDGAWADALTLIASRYWNSERITVAVRANANEVPTAEAILRISNVMNSAGMDALGMDNLVLVNDALSHSEEDRLLLAVDAVVVPEDISGSEMDDLLDHLQRIGVTAVRVTSVAGTKQGLRVPVFQICRRGS